MTYDELVTAVSSYTENTFPTADMDTFIQQAETRIYNSIQFPALRKNVTGTIPAYNALSNPRAMYVNCPDDFLAVYSLAIIDASGNYEYLLNKDVNFIRQAYPGPSSTGTPKYYALFGPATTGTDPVVLTNELSFIIGPTPDALYGVELHYFFYPASITAGTGTTTTWLSDNYDPILLYGTLVEAYTYMKGEADMMALYNAKYQEAVAQAKRLGDGMERGDAYRDGQYKQAVT
jgi:hypothetical protein